MNWNQRYIKEAMAWEDAHPGNKKPRKYRKYNYRELNSWGPDTGGISLADPFVEKYLDQQEKELYLPEAYRGKDSKGRIFVEHGHIAPIEDHLKEINKFRELHRQARSNPNFMIGVSRATSMEKPENPHWEDKPEEKGINPGDFVALDPTVKENKVDDWSAEKLIPARHYYFEPETYGLTSHWGGYHPRRGLSRRSLPSGDEPRTTPEETVAELMKRPALGREIFVKELRNYDGSLKPILPPEKLDRYWTGSPTWEYES